MEQSLHDLIHAVTRIKQLDAEEAEIRKKKRQMFCIAERMIDEMVKNDTNT